MKLRRFVYPENEIMFRIAHNGGCASFHSNEPPQFDDRLNELTSQGFIMKDGDKFYSGGQWYQRFKLTPKVNLKDLKDWL